MRPLAMGRRADLARAMHNLVRHFEDETLGVPRHLGRWRTAFERSLERDSRP